MRIKLGRWEVEQALVQYVNREMGTKIDPDDDKFYFSHKFKFDKVTQKYALKTKNKYKHHNGDFTAWEGEIEIFCGIMPSDDLV